MPYTLTVNGRASSVDVPADMPLLWVLRDVMDFKGTKFGCGMAQCGACTVHLDGEPTRACVTPVSSVGTKKITTIEGLSTDATHPVQQAWLANDVPQCGYCQAGQIMSAVALLAKKPTPTDADIDTAMAGNICRCGTYLRIRKAIHDAAGSRGTKPVTSSAEHGLPLAGTKATTRSPVSASRRCRRCSARSSMRCTPRRASAFATCRWPRAGTPGRSAVRRPSSRVAHACPAPRN